MKNKKLLARTLRQNQTDAERKLWYLLKNRNFSGYKFRRQFSIGPYIVDFCCMKRRLIVELDGSQHVLKANQDKKRTTYLENQGYKVIRFWDDEVFKKTNSVLEKILLELI